MSNTPIHTLAAEELARRGRLVDGSKAKGRPIADTPGTIAQAKATVVQGRQLFQMGHEALAELAGATTPLVVPAPPKSARVKPKPQPKGHPAKGKSALTPEQQAKRQQIWESGVRGKAYREAMAKAGIPTGSAVKGLPKVHDAIA